MEQTTDPKQVNPLASNSDLRVKGLILGSAFGFILGILIGGGVVYFVLNNSYLEKQLELNKLISETQNQRVQLNQQKESEKLGSSNNQNPANNQTTLIKINEDERSVNYSGSIIVSGRYQEIRPGWNMGGNLCFYADSETGHLIPRDPNLYGEGGGDKRIPWFCFSNQDKVKEMFEIDETKIFEDKAIECIEGKATVEVSDYIVNKVESQVFDTANLVRIISTEKYSPQCE